MADLVRRAIRFVADEVKLQSDLVRRSFRWDYLARSTTARTIFEFGEKTDGEGETGTWIASANPESTCDFCSVSGTFSGTLVPPTDPSQSGASSRAYCAIRADIPKLLRDCHDYEGLEMKLRIADANVYAVNLTAKSFFPDDLYQGFLVSDRRENSDNIDSSVTDDKDDRWMQARLNFDDFLLTSYGYEKAVQRELNTESLSTVGFTVISENESPFEMQIEWIRAVPYDDGIETSAEVTREEAQATGEDDDPRRRRVCVAAEAERRERIERAISKRKNRSAKGHERNS